jgi:hypothetical protein
MRVRRVLGRRPRPDVGYRSRGGGGRGQGVDEDLAGGGGRVRSWRGLEAGDEGV